MDYFSDLDLSEDLSKLRSFDELFTAPIQAAKSKSDRNEEELNVLFGQRRAVSASPGLPIRLEQIKVQPSPQLPVRNLQEEREQQCLKELLFFFHKYPFVSINNFKQLEKLLFAYLSPYDNIKGKINTLECLLTQKLDQNHSFGKLSLGFIINPTSVEIKIERSKIQAVTQMISLNFNKYDFHKMLVMTKWNWSNKKVELIRSRAPFRSPRASDQISVEFDAKVWKSFNRSGIGSKNFMKSLDCIERNHLNFPEFIHYVNKKTALDFLTDDLITNTSIKTNNKDISFIEFRTNTGQKVETKLSGFCSCITVGS